MRKSLLVYSILLLAVIPSIGNAKDFSSRECPVVGNTESRIYHIEGCRNYAMMLVKNKGFDNRQCFNSRSEAEAAGFRKARNCRR